MASSRPVVVLQPAPQLSSRIFSPARLDELHANFTVVDLEQDHGADAFEEALGRAFAVIGQPDLDRARLDRAVRLRAICNVEGNFFPNVDYETCFARGIYVLGCGPAYAQAVAEHALGLALDLARGISREDRAFRLGREHYVAAGNEDSILLSRAPVGLIGYGNLGRALHRLLRPFAPEIRVFDPWLPADLLRERGLRPVSLVEALTQSRFVFVLATVTEESQHLLGADELDLLQADARLILVSRAAVVDFDALMSRLAAGRFRAAIDVWPTEPLPPDDPARTVEGLLFSGHRAGGIPEAFLQIGEMVVDDLRQIVRGLPPVRMQVAARELVGRYRNRPVS